MQYVKNTFLLAIGINTDVIASSIVLFDVILVKLNIDGISNNVNTKYEIIIILL